MSCSSMNSMKKDLVKLRSDLTKLQEQISTNQKKMNDLRDRIKRAQLSTCSSKCKKRSIAYKKKMLEEQEKAEVELRRMEKMLIELEWSCAMVDRLYH